MAFDKENRPVFTRKINAGKRRTYFIDVRTTRGGDYYLTLTESTRKSDGEGFNRHKLFLYKEDFNKFQGGLDEAINHVKTELMPDYDYEEFDKEYEDDNDNDDNPESGSVSDEDETDEEKDRDKGKEEDMSW